MTTLIFTKIVCGIAFLCFLGVGIAWYHASVKDAGYQEATAHYEARIAQLDLLAQRRMQEAKDKAQQQADELRATINIINTRRTAEQKAADEHINLLRDSIANRTVRLSVPTTSAQCAVSPIASAANSPVAGGSGREARCDLSQSAAEFLTAEAARCDGITRQLNAVIDSYEAVRVISSPASNTGLSAPPSEYAPHSSVNTPSPLGY